MDQDLYQRGERPRGLKIAIGETTKSPFSSVFASRINSAPLVARAAICIANAFSQNRVLGPLSVRPCSCLFLRLALSDSPVVLTRFVRPIILTFYEDITHNPSSFGRFLTATMLPGSVRYRNGPEGTDDNRCPTAIETQPALKFGFPIERGVY